VASTLPDLTPANAHPSNFSPDRSSPLFQRYTRTGPGDMPLLARSIDRARLFPPWYLDPAPRLFRAAARSNRAGLSAGRGSFFSEGLQPGQFLAFTFLFPVRRPCRVFLYSSFFPLCSARWLCCSGRRRPNSFLSHRGVGLEPVSTVGDIVLSFFPLVKLRERVVISVTSADVPFFFS